MSNDKDKPRCICRTRNGERCKNHRITLTACATHAAQAKRAWRKILSEL